MNQSVLILLFIILHFPSPENKLDAQSNSKPEVNYLLWIDTCKLIKIEKDTIFYPDVEVNNNVWIEYEEMPEFPGGEKAVIEYIKNNTIYPQNAIKDSIQGKVHLTFIIDSVGSTGNFQILKSVRDDVDNECIRVIQGMPKWKPGRVLTRSEKGWYWKEVKVYYIIMFNFLLEYDFDAKGIIILPNNMFLK